MLDEARLARAVGGRLPRSSAATARCSSARSSPRTCAVPTALPHTAWVATDIVDQHLAEQERQVLLSAEYAARQELEDTIGIFEALLECAPIGIAVLDLELELPPGQPDVRAMIGADRSPGRRVPRRPRDAAARGRRRPAPRRDDRSHARRPQARAAQAPRPSVAARDQRELLPDLRRRGRSSPASASPGPT